METILLLFLLIAFLYFLKREYSNSLTENSFISIVNHTFRTPLTHIKWLSDSLNQSQSIEEQKIAAQNISNSVNRIIEIIDTLTGIKDIRNNASYNLKAVSVREIIEEAIAKYRNTINTKKIILEVPALLDIPLLALDPKKISFVIHVLLENAIYYSKEGGTIRIGAGVKDKNLLIGIDDSGIGMNWLDKNNVFGRFYRSDRAKKMNTDGMGLGLYISKEIIRRHKGKLYFVSKGKDKGTTFYIELPINR